MATVFYACFAPFSGAHATMDTPNDPTRDIDATARAAGLRLRHEGVGR